METEAPNADTVHAGNPDVASIRALLLVLTVVTGLVDAISYLSLGHVFVANMTGNVVFLGFAAAGATGFSISASLVAIAGFLVGAFSGGRLASGTRAADGRLLALAVLAKILLVGAALVVAVSVEDLERVDTRYSLIVLLAIAMGLQNAITQRLAAADLSTTVLTHTLTGLAADSKLAGGNDSRPGRRLLSAAAMLAGAAVGAFLVLQYGLGAALALTFVLLLGNGVAAYRVAASSPGR